MKTKRIIPCLDIMNGRAVKGVQFVDIEDVGDIVELATKYSKAGADELILLDITASVEKRKTSLDWISDVAKAIDIPFTIGGGINSLDDVKTLLDKGATKVSVNTGAISNPDIINEISKKFGREKLVVAIDAKRVNGEWYVVGRGGTDVTVLDLVDWAKVVETRGAGEILFTSMDHDGTKTGFALDAVAKVADSLAIPIIASGGAGSMEDFYKVFTEGCADAATASSIFHSGEITIPELKKYLISQKVKINK